MTSPGGDRRVRWVISVETATAIQNMRQLAATTDQVGSGAQDAQKKASGWGDALKTGLGVVGVQAGFQGIVGGFKSVISSGVDYERSQNQLQAVSGASATEMARVADTARQLGNDVKLPGASAATATQAMLALAKGGLTAQQAMDAARGTMVLAAAAQVDGAQAAEIQSAALNTFGLKADQAGRVANVLANVANKSSGEITDFAQGLSQAGTVAATFGWSIEDTTNYLGLMANAGIQGSDAGTSLKTALTALVKPTKDQAQALEVLGIQTRDSNGNLISARELAVQLAAAKGTLSAADFEQAASTAFGTDAMRTAFVAASNGAAGYDEMAAALNNASGAQDVAAANSKGLSGVIDGFKNAVNDASLSVFEKLSPSIQNLTTAATSLIGPLGDSLAPLLGTIAQTASSTLAPAIIGLSTALGVVLTPVVKLLDVINDLPTPIGTAVLALGTMIALRGRMVALWTSFTGGITAARASLTGYVASIRTAATATATAGAAMRGAMAFLGGPLGLALIGVTTAMTLFSSSTDDATESTSTFTDAIDKQTGALNANAPEAISAAVRTSGLGAAYEALGGNVSEVVDALGGVPGAMDIVNERINNAQKAAQAAGYQTDQLGRAVAGTTTSYEGMGLSFGNTSAAAQQNSIDFLNAQKATDLLAQVSGQLSSEQTGVKQEAEGASGALAGYIDSTQGSAQSSEDLAKAVQKVNDELGETRPAIAFKAAIDQVKNAAQETDLAAQAMSISLLQAAGSNLTQEQAARANQAAMRLITSAARAHESAVADLAAKEQELSDLRDHGTLRAGELEAAQKSATDAANDATKAQTELSKAQAKAQQDVLDAQNALQKARDKAKQDNDDAQTGLGKAQADAARDLQDAQSKLAGVQGDGKSSAEDLSAAQQRVADATRDGADKVAAAQRRVEDARSAGADAVESAERRVSDAQTAGADSIAAAQDRLTAANDAVNEAQQRVSDTQARGVPTAAELAAAQRAVADANDQVKSTAEAQADANDKAGQSARDMAAAAGASAAANGDLKTATEQSTGVLGQQREAFINSQIEAGKSREEAEKLADQQGLIPGNVTTFYEQAGLDAAIIKAQALNAELDKLDNKTVRYTAIGNQVYTNLQTSVGPTALQALHGDDPATQAYEQAQRDADNKARNFGYTPVPRAEGGIVIGPGGPRDDKIHAKLSNGEFVVRAAQVAKYRSLLEAINGGMAGFADGGLVGTNGAAVVATATAGELLASKSVAQVQAPAPDLQVAAAGWDALAAAIIDAWAKAADAVSAAQERISVAEGKLDASTVVSGDAQRTLLDAQVAPVWDGIVSRVTTSQNALAAVHGAWNASTTVAGQNQAALRGLVDLQWAGIVDRVTLSWNAGLSPTFTAINAGADLVGRTQSALRVTVDTEWLAIGSRIQLTQSSQIAPAWQQVQDFAAATGAFFVGVNAGVQGATTVVTNDIQTIRKALDEFFKLVDGRATGAAAGGTAASVTVQASGVQALADGGIITAGTGPRSDDVVVHASKGEYVVNAASTAKNRALLDSINYGGAYADGGLISDSVSKPLQSVMVSTTQKAITAGIERIITAAADPMIAGSFSGAVPEGARGKFLEAILSKQGTSYVWGAAGPDVFDCSGLMSWGLIQAGVGKGRLTAAEFGDRFPRATPEKPGDLALFDTGRVSPKAGHIGAVLDPIAGTMMHTDGAGPARISPYRSRSGLMGFADAIGGAYTPSSSPESKLGDPPAANWLQATLDRIKTGVPIGAGGTGAAGGLMISPTADVSAYAGKTKDLNTVDPIVNFGARNMERGRPEYVGAVPPGGAEERWRPLYAYALRAKGKYSDGALNNMMYQMHTESSGDPLSYNDYDSNFTAGKPSKSLLQTIPGTFRANAEPGYSTNIWDPLSNAFAAVNYVAANYGGVFPGRAYDLGGPLKPGYTLAYNGTGGDETILTGPQSQTAAQAVNHVIQGGAAPSIQITNYVDAAGILSRTEVMVDGKMQQLRRDVRTVAAQG